MSRSNVFEPFMPPGGALEAAQEAADNISSAAGIETVQHHLGVWSLADLLGAFPWPGGSDDDGSAARYLDMIAAMGAGNVAAAEAYRQTAVNFRPVNGLVVDALRGLVPKLGSTPEELFAPEHTVDDFGHVNDLAGAVLLGEYVGREIKPDAEGDYRLSALHIVNTLVVPVRMAIALRANGNIQNPREIH